VVTGRNPMFWLVTVPEFMTFLRMRLLMAAGLI
jgi:hypothetical protein